MFQRRAMRALVLGIGAVQLHAQLGDAVDDRGALLHVAAELVGVVLLGRDRDRQAVVLLEDLLRRAVLAVASALGLRLGRSLRRGGIGSAGAALLFGVVGAGDARAQREGHARGERER